jgi:hypothetical protein
MVTKHAVEHKYSIVKGDIFEHSTNRIKAGSNGCHVIIPHVCNNVNAFGAGFAADVAERFPEVKANFHLLGKNAKLGNVQYITVKTDTQYKYTLTIANMIAQNKLINPKNPRPLNYAALAYCMSNVKNMALKLKDNIESTGVEIHAPKFGSGLAGGNWNFILDLIHDTWYDLDVFVYLKQ